MTGHDDAAATPVFGVAKGNPSDEELAAVITALTAVTAAGGPVDNDSLGDRPRAGGWKSYYRVMRRPMVPGRDGWKAAFLRF